MDNFTSRNLVYNNFYESFKNTGKISPLLQNKKGKDFFEFSTDTPQKLMSAKQYVIENKIDFKYQKAHPFRIIINV